VHKLEEMGYICRATSSKTFVRFKTLADVRSRLREDIGRWSMKSRAREDRIKLVSLSVIADARSAAPT